MIHPSYVDLMNVVNEGTEESETPVINSRYSIVMATAKRARQIIDGDEPMIADADGKKPLSIAVEEMEEGELKILPQDAEEIRRYEEKDRSVARALEYGLTEELLAATEAAENAGDEEALDDQDAADDVVAAED